MTDLALLSIEGPVATLSLNRPDARNALSTDLLAALHDRCAELEARRDVIALILTGAGRAFCAGMDLKAVLGNAELAAKLLGSLAELTLRLRALPMVTIAKVNGAAIGGGCGLACVCDFALTHADSKMGFPEVDLGVCPAVVAPWVVRKIGPGRARAVLLQGGLMSGLEAHSAGLVSQVLPTREELDQACATLAKSLAQGGPNALRATKNLLNQLDGSLDPASVREGARLSASVLASPEAQAMLGAKFKSA